MRTPTTPTEARTASADTLLQLIAWWTTAAPIAPPAIS